MGASIPDPDSPLPLPWSANDRFKSRWRTWVFRSFGVAVALHGLALVLWPTWTASELFPESGGEGWDTQLIALAEASLSPSAGIPNVIRPILDEAAEPSFEEEGGGEDETGEELGSWDWDARGPSQALRERFERREPPVPTVVEPEAVAAAQDASAEEGGSTRIGGTASATDGLDSRMDRILDLDRLSAARPELALFSPSNAFLLRNPDEVEAFLRSRLEPRRRSTGPDGSVGVAIWIDETGAVEWAEISQSSGRSDLDEVALELFTDVVAFHPARERGVRVPVSVLFWLTFPW
jgi:TonB family protein